MRLTVLLLPLLAWRTGASTGAPRRYAIDLDTPPAHRWDEIVADHKGAIPLVIEDAKFALPL